MFPPPTDRSPFDRSTPKGSATLSRRTAIAAALAGLTVTACGVRPPNPQPTPAGRTSSATPTPAAAGSTSSSATPSASASPKVTVPNPARIKANELGMVPVMMYHRLTSDGGEYDISPKAFAAHLTRLFHSGYVPIDADDLAAKRIDVPAGKTPVVLTFDDGSAHQFRLRPDGRLDPSCAAGILSTVASRFPGCQPKATFYVNKNPFGMTSAGAQAKTLRALVELGFSLGNHTFDHPDLAQLSSAQVQREFVEIQQLVQRAVPDYRLDTMALPFGVAPNRRALAARGHWDQTGYAFRIALLVGANPAPSPFAASFQPHAVPRIRVSSWHNGSVPLTGNYWLDYLDKHPDRRYISAGNPDKITFPEDERHLLAPGLQHRAVSYRPSSS